MSGKVVRYEDNAEMVTVAGWICKTCRRFYGSDEGMSRRCCATDLPCPECSGRRDNKSYTVCAACRQKKKEERWRKLERVEWDGETPVQEWDGDRLFLTAEDLADWLEISREEDESVNLEDLRLVLCEPEDEPREFDVDDFLSDDLPEDYEIPGAEEINFIVNRWIKEKVPILWWHTNKAVSLESLRVNLSQYANGES